MTVEHLIMFLLEIEISMLKIVEYFGKVVFKYYYYSTFSYREYTTMIYTKIEIFIHI